MAIKDIHENLTVVTNKEGVEVARIERPALLEEGQPEMWHLYRRVEGPNPEFEASTYTYHFAEAGSFATKTEALSAASA